MGTKFVTCNGETFFVNDEEEADGINQKVRKGLILHQPPYTRTNPPKHIQRTANLIGKGRIHSNLATKVGIGGVKLVSDS
jgi:hypothetical protein